MNNHSQNNPKPFGLRTRHIENIFVLLVLAIPLYISGYHATDWLAYGAVFFTFKHAQIADRMREQEEAREKPSIECAEWSDRFFVAKEVLWVGFFILAGAYTALVGCGLFLLYPAWRRFYRKRWPL